MSFASRGPCLNFDTAQKMEKSLMENFIFSAVWGVTNVEYWSGTDENSYHEYEYFHFNVFITNTPQKMKKSLMKNFIYCAVRQDCKG